MANLMDLLLGGSNAGSGSGTGDLISMITKQVVGSNDGKTQLAAQGILTTLMSGMAKNAATPEGASSLLSALDRDHDGSVLDDVMGLVTGANQSKATNGSGIIKHVLGNQSDNVFGNIAKASGLDISNVAGMATKLAPLLMGVLGKQRRNNALDANNIGDFLKNSAQEHQQKVPGVDIFSRLLDQDGDGQIMDDIANIGMKMFSNFLKK